MGEELADGDVGLPGGGLGEGGGVGWLRGMSRAQRSVARWDRGLRGWYERCRGPWTMELGEGGRWWCEFGRYLRRGRQVEVLPAWRGWRRW